MVIIYLLIGLVSGSLISIIGTGAGLIIIPALVFFAHFDQKTAVGTSLMTFLFPVGIFAVANYYKHGYFNTKAAGFIVVGFLIGTLIMSKFAIGLPTEFLERAFGVVAVLIGVKMLFF